MRHPRILATLLVGTLAFGALASMPAQATFTADTESTIWTNTVVNTGGSVGADIAMDVDGDMATCGSSGASSSVQYSGFSYSSDDGATWFPSRSNPSGSTSSSVTYCAVAFTPSGHILYVQDAMSSFTVLRSTNNGLTWGQTNGGSALSSGGVCTGAAQAFRIEAFSDTTWMVAVVHATGPRLCTWYTTNTGTSYTFASLASWGSGGSLGLANGGTAGRWLAVSGANQATGDGTTWTNVVMSSYGTTGLSFSGMTSTFYDSTTDCVVTPVITTPAVGGVGSDLGVTYLCYGGSPQTSTFGYAGYNYGGFPVKISDNGYIAYAEGGLLKVTTGTAVYTTTNTVPTTFNMAGIRPSGEGVELAAVYAESTSFKLLKFTFVPTGSTESTFIATTGLVEADADSAGTVIIARTENGANIRSFSATDASQTGTLPTTDCGGRNGVSSFNKEGTVYLSFGDCDDDGDVTTLKVRSAVLGPPAFPSGCDDECQQNNDQFVGCTLLCLSDFDVPADMYDLGTLYTAPYSFTFANGLPDSGYASWTFSTKSGEIGIVGVIYNEGAIDSGDRALVTINGGSIVDDFCAWYNADAGKDYAAGVAQDGPTKVIETRATLDNTALLPNGIDVSAGAVYSNVNPYGKASAISCQGNHIFVKNYATGTVYFLNVTGPNGEIGQVAQVWSAPTTDGFPGSVTLSNDGLWAAYRDGSDIHIAYASNGTIVNTVNVPGEGTWVGMELDGVGAQLFVYEADGITIYDVHATTCDTACVTTTDDGGVTLPGAGTGSSSASGSTSCSILCVDSATVPEGFTVGGFNALLGVLLMAGVGGGFYFIDTKSRYSVLFGCIGAAVGFFLAYSFGLFPLWLILLGVLVVVAVIVMRFRGGL